MSEMSLFPPCELKRVDDLPEAGALHFSPAGDRASMPKFARCRDQFECNIRHRRHAQNHVWLNPDRGSTMTMSQSRPSPPVATLAPLPHRCKTEVLCFSHCWWLSAYNA